MIKNFNIEDFKKDCAEFELDSDSKILFIFIKKGKGKLSGDR